MGVRCCAVCAGVLFYFGDDDGFVCGGGEGGDGRWGDHGGAVGRHRESVVIWEVGYEFRFVSRFGERVWDRE